MPKCSIVEDKLEAFEWSLILVTSGSDRAVVTLNFIADTSKCRSFVADCIHSRLQIVF